MAVFVSIAGQYPSASEYMLTSRRYFSTLRVQPDGRVARSGCWFGAGDQTGKDDHVLLSSARLLQEASARASARGGATSTSFPSVLLWISRCT